VFASEVRALLASGRIERRLSPSALSSYLLFGSLAEPETLISGLFSLPPGYFLHVADVTHPSVSSPKRYWSLADATARAPQLSRVSFADAAKQLRPLLESAVRRHLIADVPLGLFLSSGMDSTCLAALAARERGALYTFTVVFSELGFSEAPMARRVAERLGAKHEEMLLTAADVLARIDEAVAALDQPTADGINTYFVSWAARQAGLKVALSGLGGDEVFGGYSTFRSTPRAGRVRALARAVPKSLRSLAAGAVLKTAGKGKRADAVRKGVSAWRSPDALPHAHFFARSLFPPESCAELLGRESRASLAESAAGAEPAESWRAWLDDAAREVQGRDAFTAVSWLEMRSYMVNMLLRDTDAVSMAHSLEVRVPLLDHELVEFVAALPGAAKQRAGQPKALLAEAVRDILPAEVLRQPKRTFTLPWEHWLRGPLGDRVARDLHDLSAPLRDHLESKSVRAVWRNFRAGQTGWSRPWSLYVLNEWVRRNVAAPIAIAPAASEPRQRLGRSRLGWPVGRGSRRRAFQSREVRCGFSRGRDPLLSRSRRHSPARRRSHRDSAQSLGAPRNQTLVRHAHAAFRPRARPRARAFRRHSRSACRGLRLRSRANSREIPSRRASSSPSGQRVFCFAV
jgi:asparagine synthase (glutamine-hydrolysing)